MKPRCLAVPILVLALILAACEPSQEAGPKKTETPPEKPAEKSEPTKPETSTTGTLVGKVLFKGKLPAPRKIQVSKDQEVCTHAKGEIHEVEVSDGALKGAVAEVSGLKAPKGGWDWKHPAEGYMVRQKGCMFEPRMLVVPDGGELTIYNDDPVLHNIATGQWDVAQPAGAEPEKRKIKFMGRPFIRGTCNIHSWMETWIYVARSPFHATSGKDGTFRIENIPAGSYRILVTHPTLGTQRVRVKIEAGKTTEEEITFK